MPEVPGRTASMTERFDTVNPRTPHVQLLSGGEWMLAVTDTGAGVSCCRGLDMTWYSADLLRRPQGVFVLVEGGEGAFPSPGRRITGRMQRIRQNSAPAMRPFMRRRAVWRPVCGWWCIRICPASSGRSPVQKSDSCPAEGAGNGIF